MGVAQTKAQTAKGDTKPDKDFDAIGQLALKAQGLATKYQATLGKRLTASFMTSFGDDITALSTAVPTVIQTKDGTVQLTAAQRKALAAGHKLAKGLRTTIKGFAPDKETRLAYGIGTKVNKLIVKEVTASLQKIADRMKAQPAEATAFGLVDDDANDIQAALQAIKDAGKAQGQSRAAAPQATRDRNAIARRLLAGVKKIAGIGMRAFANDPTTYANFEALVNKAAA
jgi:hypothetical protein